MRKKKKLISVGSRLTTVEGTNWQFDVHVAQYFDKHVKQSIPHYESIQKYICSFSEWFIKKDSIIYDLGCSTGETAKNICNFHYNKKVNRYGLLPQSLLKNWTKLNIQIH